ncbi:type II toxin-antitoxin system Phd/YefM family antitoxin [Dyella japonica]|uniref:type II toxin-antitoxin system Phd/YefM family antitoxin n=1 Tax=Dyella japonica TaxID=231455 RepID=UPI0009E3FE32|nr:type II toxin-antitoxin system prevent-host-death family antitoxin [Dyella japonica]
MRTVNFTEARNNLKAVADQVAEDHTATLITRRDAEDLVMLSASDYNSIQEMLYLLSSRANAARLNEAMEEADAGLPATARVLTPDDLADLAPRKRQAGKVMDEPSHPAPMLIRRHTGVETKVKAGDSKASRVSSATSGKPKKSSKATPAKPASKPKKKA